ncbi:hypothetical protein Mapa_007380 [Marchantia paleacea]|nr:hypothetical protein Mapa_007380 [Marchantia paleacea]
MEELLSFRNLFWCIPASILLHWMVKVWLRSKRLPPGPKPWPLVGSVLTLMRHDYNPLMAAQKLEAKNGKVITFWMGNRPLIVINDSELAHDCLIKQKGMFANRCRLSSQSEISRGFKTIATSHGAISNAMRKNLVTNVLRTKAVRALKAHQDAMLDEAMVHIEQAVAASIDGTSKVPVLTVVRLALFKCALFMNFGMDLGPQMIQKIDDIMHQRVTSAFSLYLGDYIPVCRLFEIKNRRVLMRNQRSLEKIVLPIIQKVRDLKREGNIIPGTYVETLIDLQETEGKNYLDDLAIVCFCNELIAAFTHTTAAAVQAGMSVLAERADIQAALFEEIERVVGQERVDEAHLGQLPYLAAFATEVLRMYPPLSSTIPHAAVEHCKLGGYDIPPDAVVYIHIQAYQTDPKAWTDPLKFRPERFLQTEVDFTGTRNAKFIPFGAGRRICPGISLGLMDMLLMISRMVQSFEWKNDEVVSKEDPARDINRSPDVGRLGPLPSTQPVRQNIKKPLIARRRNFKT